MATPQEAIKLEQPQVIGAPQGNVTFTAHMLGVNPKGASTTFVLSEDDAERLGKELQRYAKWAQETREREHKEALKRIQDSLEDRW